MKMPSLHFMVYIFVLIITIVAGQTTPPTCSNTNFQLTPSLRGSLLNAVNQVRSEIQNGEFLLQNGKHALPAANMPQLTWDCEIEEELHEYLQASCSAFPAGSGMPYPTLVWSWFGLDIVNAETFIQDMLTQYPSFLAQTFLSLSRTPLSTSQYPSYGILNDQVERFACAFLECDVGSIPGNWYPGSSTANLYCKVDTQPQFGENLYQVAASANYVPPSPDVICLDSIFSVELREMFLGKINKLRSKLVEGELELENGNHALKAAALNPIQWSCAEEASIGLALTYLTCDDPLYNPATEFYRKIIPTHEILVPEDVDKTVTKFANLLFVKPNPNFNFLSQSTIYSTQYPAAFALSDQASTIGCNQKYCFIGSQINFNFVCRVQPSIQIGSPLYQVSISPGGPETPIGSL